MVSMVGCVIALIRLAGAGAPARARIDTALTMLTM